MNAWIQTFKFDPHSLFQSIPKCYIENLKGYESKCYLNLAIEDLKFDFFNQFS